MKKAVIGVIFAVVADQALFGQPDRSLGEVQYAIKQRQATWVAGRTSLSRLSGEDVKALFPTKYAMTVPYGAKVNLLSSLPSHFDWREHNGNNYVTSVKEQVGFSCGAFAATGAFESAVLRTQGTPGLDLDLSEHILCACPNGGCNNLHQVAAFLENTGLPLDMCYPWTDPSSGCDSACPGWQNKTDKLVGWNYYQPRSVEEIKTLIVTFGPVVTGMNAPPDFMYHYKGGVYTDVWENVAISQVTIEACLIAAKAAGFAYAGLQDGGQCFAGNTLGYTKVDEAQCNMPCAADEAEKCGGPWRNSIYSTALYPFNFNEADCLNGCMVDCGNQCVGGDKGTCIRLCAQRNATCQSKCNRTQSAYQGCYTDDGERALPIDLDSGLQNAHSVLLIGYDDSGQYFIGKNSWGVEWGEAAPNAARTTKSYFWGSPGGYFRISYSQFKSKIVQFGTGVHVYPGAIAAHALVVSVSPHPVPPGLIVPITVHASDFQSGVPVKGNVVINGTLRGVTDQAIIVNFTGQRKCKRIYLTGGNSKPIPDLCRCDTEYPYSGYVESTGYDRVALDFGLSSRDAKTGPCSVTH